MPQDVVAIVTEGKFEDLELFVPKMRFEEAGFRTEVLTADGEKREGKMGYPVEADESLDAADPERYAALLIPGGTGNADHLRTRADAVEFAGDFWQLDRPVFSICHGPWLLVEADVLHSVEMTSYWSLRTDCENAGALWRDAEVVVDGRLVTSRHPPDLPAFNRECLRLLSKLRGAEAAAPQAGL